MLEQGEGMGMKRWTCFLFVLLSMVCSAGIAHGGDVESTGRSAESENGISERCGMEPEGGSCKALLEMYYYDRESKKCHEFMYGGCGGTVPFESLQECRAACENPDDLHISFIRPEETGPYGIVELEYPMKWDEPEFNIYVDGQEAQSMRTVGGFVADRNTATFLVALAEAGLKKIRVVGENAGETREATITHYWRGPGVLKLLDHTGLDEAVFGDEIIRFFAFQVDDLSFFLNGEEMVPVDVVDNNSLGSIYSVHPQWIPGMNTLEVKAANSTQDIYTTPYAFNKSYTFYYISDEKTALGDSFTLIYGYPGGKSGPWFEVECDETKISLSQGEGIAIYTLFEEKWLGKDSVYVVRIESVEKGRTKIQIYENAHYLKDKQIVREIELDIF